MKSLHLSCITILKGAALRRSLRAEKRSYNFTQIRRFSTATRSHSTKPPLCKPSLSELQSSSNKKHSTTTLDFAHSSPSIITTQSATTTPKPTKAALQTLFTASAIPMIGFGFMDNFVMIQAGQYIDSTLGVSLGLATMTAAAAGQVVSDVSGVVFGGTLERFLTRLKLIKTPALSAAQRQLPIARNVAMGGAVIGVIFGCALGATTLLLVDLEARDRIQRVNRLREIVNDMVVSDFDGCESCTVYIASAFGDFTFDSEKHRTTVKQLEDTDDTIHRVMNDRKAILVDDGNLLFSPVVNKDDEIVAILELKASSSSFDDKDIATARVMARHIAIFMDRLVD